MTRRPHILAAILAPIALGLSCGGDPGGTGVDDTVASVVVSPPEVTLEIGQTRQLQVTVTNAAGDGLQVPVTWTSAAPGIASVDDDGVVTGESGGTVRVTAAAGGRSGHSDVTVEFETAEITTLALPEGEVGVAYSTTLAASGGDGSFAWSLVGGELPRGLTLAADGEISGEPQVPGDFDVSLRLDTGDGQSVLAMYTLTVTGDFLPLEVVTAELPDGLVGDPYSVELEATGGDFVFVWAVTAGGLPDGLALAADGTLSGTPSAEGSTAFTVEVSSAGMTATADYTVDVFLPLVVTTTSLPGATVGVPYDVTLQSTGGGGAVTWSLVSGTLPSGLTLSDTGTLSGTPMAGGNRNLGFEASSEDGQTATVALTLAVAEPLKVTNNILPPGVEGTAYQKPLTAEGGDGTSFAWTLESGTLPPGIVLGSGGVLSGTPTAGGSYDFTVRVESGGDIGFKSLQVVVEPDDPAGYAVTVLPLAPIDPAVKPAFDAAVSRWEAIITGDLPGMAFGNAFPTGSCFGFGPLLNGGAVEDMVIVTSIEPIDGVGGTLAFASFPCATRASGLPVASYIQFDLEDLLRIQETTGNQRIQDIMFHELGHTLGFSVAVFDELGLRSGNDFNPRFVGPRATAEWQALGQSGNPPLEAINGQGSPFSHWREAIFDNEIMTGLIDGSNPLSRVTIGAMEDMGYEVDLTQADAYSLAPPPAVASGVYPGPDVLPGPTLVLDRDGRVIRVRRPGGGR